MNPKPAHDINRDGLDGRTMLACLAAIPGGTNTNLTLGSLTLAQSGSYEVEVYNAYGWTESDAAQFTVLPAPTGRGSLDVAFDPTASGASLLSAAR